MSYIVEKSGTGKNVLIKTGNGHLVDMISPAEAMNLGQQLQILAGSMLEIKKPKRDLK